MGRKWKAIKTREEKACKVFVLTSERGNEEKDKKLKRKGMT